MTLLETVVICVIAFVALTIVVGGLVWRLLSGLKGVFNLGRKTAKRYPWVAPAAAPDADSEEPLRR